MIIKTDDLRGPEIYALLQEHLRNMALHSPPESVHALDIDALRQPAITFWTAWDNTELLGCGALKLLDARRVEVLLYSKKGEVCTKQTQPLPKGEILVFGGESPNATAWLVTLKRTN